LRALTGRLVFSGEMSPLSIQLRDQAKNERRAILFLRGEFQLRFLLRPILRK
jgi:hypothetical protein